MGGGSKKLWDRDVKEAWGAEGRKPVVIFPASAVTVTVLRAGKGELLPPWTKNGVVALADGGRLSRRKGRKKGEQQAGNRQSGRRARAELEGDQGTRQSRMAGAHCGRSGGGFG